MVRIHITEKINMRSAYFLEPVVGTNSDLFACRARYNSDDFDHNARICDRSGVHVPGDDFETKRTMMVECDDNFLPARLPQSLFE